MRLHNNNEIVDYVDLFVSVLISFPELMKIRFDRDNNILYFSFMLRSAISLGEFSDKMDKVRLAIEKYHRLNGSTPYRFSAETWPLKEYVVLQLQRDMLSLNPSEVTLIPELIRNEFCDFIMTEKIEERSDEDSPQYYEEGRNHRINDRKMCIDEKNIGNQIIACREAGKVLVFSN